jgi:hypothetical protein
LLLSVDNQYGKLMHGWLFIPSYLSLLSLVHVKKLRYIFNVNFEFLNHEFLSYFHFHPINKICFSRANAHDYPYSIQLNNNTAYISAKLIIHYYFWYIIESLSRQFIQVYTFFTTYWNTVSDYSIYYVIVCIKAILFFILSLFSWFLSIHIIFIW